MPAFLRGNPNERLAVDYRQSEFQRLLYQILITDKTCGIAELAEFLGKAPDTVYAYAEGELRLHVDEARRIRRFVSLINPRERRLLEYWNGPDCVALPIGKKREATETLARELLERVTKANEEYDKEGR